MPDYAVVKEFLEVTREDFRSPTTSEFVSRIPQFKNSVSSIEDALDGDREGLMKVKKSLKSIHQSGNTNLESELSLSKALERLGNSAAGQDPEMEAAFLKFAVVTKDLSSLKKTLMQNLQNMILFPLDQVLKGEIKGVKGDLRRPFDKAHKDYEARYNKLEKEKKSLARDAGMIRKEVTPAEIADETERERRLLQLHLAEYYLKVNEIRTKKGVELLKHLVEYYHALNSYFQDGLKTMEHFGDYVSILSTNLAKIKLQQDDERKNLNEMKHLLKTTPLLEKELTGPSNSGPASYNLHQIKGNKSVGVTKMGYLNKKSEGKMRRVWQKRKCAVQDGFLHIFHGDETKQPSRVNLLTCQLKIVTEDRKFFDLVSYNRTYHLNSEDDAEEWISVILNSKEAAMEEAFDGKVVNNGVKWREITQAILGHVHHLPGNSRCADCDSENDVTWLSVNLGVIVCIECSGIHRTLGVGVSRIQSIYLDHIPPSLLILSVRIGNSAMNQILEDSLKPGAKPVPSSTMEDRTEFITAKYVDKKFVAPCADRENLIQTVERAIETNDLMLLVKCWAQGAVLNLPLPSRDTGETPLHVAILRGFLPVVDFLVHNAGSLDKKTRNGSTPLHYCAFYGRTEPTKLLLRAGADLQAQDKDKHTPLEVAKSRDNKGVEELMLHAMEGKKTLFESVDFDWNLGADDSTDMSEDEFTGFDDSATTPDKSRRPNSFFVESPYKVSTNDSSYVGTPESTVSAKINASKRVAPAPPESNSSHIRSPSDPMIQKLNLGPRVIPQGEPPQLRKTLPPQPGAAIQPSSTFSHIHTQYSGPFNILGNIVTPSTGIQHSATTVAVAVPSPVSPKLPNGSNSATSPPSTVDVEKLRRCRAIYDCKADNADEISFQQGELIYILSERTQDDDWMEGFIIDGNRRGMFPVSFVDFLD